MPGRFAFGDADGIRGVGKTRLAIAVAEAQADDFSDGIFFVDLSGLSDPTLVAQTVASVLELREQNERSLLQTLTAYLEPKEVLLVWDNCEHLIEGCAPLAQALLSGCPGLRLLATSRQSLGLMGEMAWRVPSLSFPQGAWSLLLEYEAVQLFVERAQQALPSFVLSGQNAAAVAQVCAHLDGIPLAIELAAARVRALSVEQMARRLAVSLGLLRGSDPTQPLRHQTLAATLDWSYGLLSEPEQRLLGRLSVFAGGWTLEAGEWIGSTAGIEAEEVLDLLTSLVDKNLVVYGEKVGEGCYRLLETVRQYARAKLIESGEAAQVQTRHRDWFLALAEEAAPQLSGTDQLSWLERLESEHANLRAALGWCLEEETGALAGLRLSGALLEFWRMRDHWSEGREHLGRALSRAGAQGSTPERARALNGAGMLATHQGDYAAAQTRHEEALRLFRELGDRNGVAWSLTALGCAACEQGDYAGATTLHEESLRLKREAGDKPGIADAFIELGRTALGQGDYTAARTQLEEGLRQYRELGDRNGVARALLHLGTLASLQGDYATAKSLHEESLRLKREAGDKPGVAFAREGLAGALAAQTDGLQAARLWGAAETIRQSTGMPLPPNAQVRYVQQVAQVRSSLGESAFSAAWEEGRAMTMEQAVTYALGEATQGA